MLKSGAFLRSFRIDEVPNLINIINGDMSFIGPRPLILSEQTMLDARRDAGVDQFKPDITGLAQVYDRDLITIEDKIKFEKQYFEIHCFTFNLKIYC